MKFLNEQAESDYNKGFKAQNGEAYGERCFTYARDWADLMEKEIEAGKTVEEVADRTGHEADTDGITGFMYGVAVSILAKTWVHGEALRKWHNKQYGQEESKGVVNPAIVTIQTK